MRTHCRLTLAGMAAGLLLSIAVGGAAANRLSVTNRSFTATWTPLEIQAERFRTIQCNVVLEGSFHSASFAKTSGLLVGFVTRGTTELCTEGAFIVSATSLPWHVRYRGFSGTLPSITNVGLGVVGAKFTIVDSNMLSCSTITTAANPAVFHTEVSNGVITGIAADEAAAIPLRGSFLCEIAGNWFLAGMGRFTLLGTTTRIRVTLI